MNKTDEYATLRAAFHAGARIQAWHLICKTSNSNQGRWETLTPPEGREPEFGCEAHLYRVHPEDISLIAELGQEVGAVASRPLHKVEPSDDEPQFRTLSNEVAPQVYFYRLGWNQCRDAMLPTSPAHTSEARDAARLDWLDAKCTNVADEYGIASQLYFGTYATGKLRESIDAAMRQEGGTP